MRTRIACLVFPALFAWSWLGLDQAPAADGGNQAEVFSGTIESIDPSGLTMTVKTAVGREVSFSVKKPELLTGLSRGERISVELDEQHVATKITKVGIPELPQPTDSGY
jgi:hypothetical protein